VQAVIHCHCAGDLDMPAASHHSKAQHSPATTPQQSLVNHSTAQLSTMIRSAAQKKHVITSAQHALSPWWQDKHKHVKLHCWQTGLQERQIKLLCLSKTSPKDSFHCLHTPSQNLDLARALNEPGGPSCTQRHGLLRCFLSLHHLKCASIELQTNSGPTTKWASTAWHIFISAASPTTLFLRTKVRLLQTAAAWRRQTGHQTASFCREAKLPSTTGITPYRSGCRSQALGSQCNVSWAAKQKIRAVGISSSIALWADTDSHNLLLPALLSTGSWMRLCW